MDTKGEYRHGEIISLSGNYSNCHWIDCVIIFDGSSDITDCTFDGCDIEPIATEGIHLNLRGCLFSSIPLTNPHISETTND